MGLFTALNGYCLLFINEEAADDIAAVYLIIPTYRNCIYVISYSYITTMSRILLLLNETEGEAQGRVLITMISYKCL